MNYWLSRPFDWWPGRRPEWAYRGLPRRIIVEDFITDIDGGLPSDIKVFVFNGVAQYLRVNYQDATGKEVAHFTRDGRELDFIFNEGTYRTPRRSPPPPFAFDLDEALSVAEQLGAAIDFARVDLYNTSRGLLVGELTSYSHAGVFSYDPPGWAYIAGQDWHPRYGRHRPTSAGVPPPRADP